MTLQNRVLPDGSIVAHPARGGFMGNRGILHDDARQLGVARWRHQNWVTCLLQFKGRNRTVMQPGHYTELFFLDEAVALAAGHRPCAECRREAYNRYALAWKAATGEAASAKTIDRTLHAARVEPRTKAQVRFEADLADLPDGCFVWREGAAWLVKGAELLRFSPHGYDARLPRGNGRALVMTPAPTVAVLRHGYAPEFHATAAP